MFLLSIVIVIQACLNIECENKHRNNFSCIDNYINLYIRGPRSEKLFVTLLS